MYVIPAIDVLDQRVVRLRQGRYDDVTIYNDNPAGMLLSWAEQGAEIVHVVDLAGARDGGGDPKLWDSLGRTGVPFQLGGGIRSNAHVEAVLAAGATRAVLGTTAVWDPDLMARIVTAVGPERVVAAVDVRDGKATGAGWLDDGRGLEAVIGDLVDAGVVRVLATGIARDGMLTGPDIELIDDVLRIAPELALIASGGVGSLDDVAAVAAMDVEAAIVGRALYDGRFTFAAAAAAARTGG